MCVFVCVCVCVNSSSNNTRYVPTAGSLALLASMLYDLPIVVFEFGSYFASFAFLDSIFLPARPLLLFRSRSRGLDVMPRGISPTKRRALKHAHRSELIIIDRPEPLDCNHVR